jgi:hypothetical protein
MVSHDEIKRMLESKRRKDEKHSIQNESIESDNNQIIASNEDDHGFLYCKKCNGYYSLQEGESVDDFESCECGGKLIYVDKIEEIESKNAETSEK